MKRRSVLVTGGASGIGLATARVLAGRGWRVSILDPCAAGPAVAITRRSRGRVFRCDVRNFSESLRIAEVLREETGLDALVNAAGVTRDRTVSRMSEAEWDEVIDVNLKGAFNLIRAVAPILRERGWGRIVNVSSINALRGKWGQANYAASKAGLLGLTRVAARELGRFGVTVNAVAPGMVDTPMTRGLPRRVLRRAAEESAVGRIAQAADVAALIAFLLADEARHVTGAVIAVDGGQTA